jgi:hypothetical protein
MCLVVASRSIGLLENSSGVGFVAVVGLVLRWFWQV